MIVAPWHEGAPVPREHFKDTLAHDPALAAKMIRAGAVENVTPSDRAYAGMEP